MNLLRIVTIGFTIICIQVSHANASDTECKTLTDSTEIKTTSTSSPTSTSTSTSSSSSLSYSRNTSIDLSSPTNDCQESKKTPSLPMIQDIIQSFSKTPTKPAVEYKGTSPNWVRRQQRLRPGAPPYYQNVTALIQALNEARSQLNLGIKDRKTIESLAMVADELTEKLRSHEPYLAGRLALTTVSLAREIFPTNGSELPLLRPGSSICPSWPHYIPNRLADLVANYVPAQDPTRPKLNALEKLNLLEIRAEILQYQGKQNESDVRKIKLQIEQTKKRFIHQPYIQ